jgi:predicted negative regulator of RcsB-dependent stress response
LEELLRAQKLTGGDPVVSEHLGDAYLLLKQKRRALENYLEAVELEPREGEQPDLLDKLEALQSEFE